VLYIRRLSEGTYKNRESTHSEYLMPRSRVEVSHSWIRSTGLAYVQALLVKGYWSTEHETLAYSTLASKVRNVALAHSSRRLTPGSKTKQTPWPLVRKRIIQTERWPLVGEI
jgi:hypothetical protein